jgi:mannan endo-1,4-beta-mannosidase
MAGTLKRLLFGAAALGVVAIAAPCVPRDESRTFEAENAVLTGTNVDTAQAGYTGADPSFPSPLTQLASSSCNANSRIPGTGYVTGFDQSTDKITFTVSSTTTKLYDLSIRYAAIYGDKRTTVILNNGAASEVSFTAGTSFTTVPAGQLLLNAGNNTIDIVSNWGWYLIDSITLTPSSPRPEHQITDLPINPAADSPARQLYFYLRSSIYGRFILSGQQDLSWANWVTQTIGKTPALLSVDLMDYSPSRVERGTVGTSIEDAIAHHQRGGIVSVLWHWNAPTGLYDTAENPWWSGFYTRATDFDVAAALSSTGNANYTLLVRDIDAIAVQLKRLQDAGVPVLFRPLHEAEGGWFWWGAKGPEPAKKLWGLLYDRLTNYHKINNLLWVWNSIAPEWYPGDEAVDILSADVYAQGNGVSRVQGECLVVCFFIDALLTGEPLANVDAV